MSLGREILPAATIGRPRFRDYPGPPTAAVLFVPFGALAAFGFLTFRAQLSPGFYWFMAFGAGFLFLGAVITFAIWLRFGMTISVRELGVVFNGVEIPYAQIDAITIRDKRRYDETATVRASTRTISIEAAGRKAKARYAGRPDEVRDDVLDMIAERVAAEPRARAGKGWRVEQGTLHMRGRSVPLSTITAAGVYEREVRLWKSVDEAHCFAVPYDSRNARILLALAKRASPPTINRQPPTGLGRLLFARRTSIASVLGNTILALFVIGIGWMCLERFLSLPRQFALGAAIGAVVLWIVHSVYRATVRSLFHERALVRVSLLGTRTLPYANVAAMQWRETAASFEHAIPMGTTVRARLTPDDGTRPLSIIVHRFRGDDPELAAVRSLIDGHIARSRRRTA